MAIVITVQTNFIRIDYVIVIPHRQFLIRHFVNLHLQKTSALRPQPSAFVPPSYFSPRFSPQTSDVIHPASLSLHPSYFSPRFSPQTSDIIHHTSSLSPSSRQSARGQRDEQHGGSGNPDNRHAPRHRTLIAASNPSPPD